MPSGPDYHGWTHTNGIDPIQFPGQIIPACRAYVQVAAGTIPDETIYSPPFGDDGVFKSSDSDDGVWQSHAHPYNTGQFFEFDDTGSGGSGTVITISGPGVFLLRGKWAFGLFGDTDFATHPEFLAQMVGGGLLATGFDDDTDNEIQLDAHVYTSGGNIDPIGWSTDSKILAEWPAATSTWVGQVPLGQLRIETLVALREGGTAFHHMHLFHGYGSALPFDSYCTLSCVRLGDFEGHVNITPSLIEDIDGGGP